MRRREFITLLGSGAVGALPLAARAQQAASPRRIGVLLVGLSPESKEAKNFRLGLRDAGYSEGRDVVIEWRLANGDYDRVPELVADLVRSKVDVIVHGQYVLALRWPSAPHPRSRSSWPSSIDPVGSGLVESLAHPGGNVTGLSMMAMELYPKRLQLLKELNPQLTRAAVFWNPDHPIPREGGRRTQGSCALAFDRTEFRGCAKGPSSSVPPSRMSPEQTPKCCT